MKKRWVGVLWFAVVVIAVGVVASGRFETGGVSDSSALPAGISGKDEARVVVDALGRSVRVPVRPARIVSLSPALTETLFAVGAGDQVVGVTAFCDFPPEAANRVQVGGFADPSVERVVALRPDLVLATADTVSRERFDAMVSLGLASYAVNPRDLASIARSIRTVGDLTGHAGQGENVAAEFERRAREVARRIAGREARSAIFLFDLNPLIAAGPDSFVDELLRSAGGRNIAADAPTSYPRFGVEGILAHDPDVVFTTAPGGRAALESLLKGTRAAASGAVHQLDPDLLERPGPRLADGLEDLARRLHPEAFEPLGATGPSGEAAE